jgi:hypothetical protein
MVMSLAALQGVEDRNLLAGSLLVLLGQDFNHAQVRGAAQTVTSVLRLAVHSNGCATAPCCHNLARRSSCCAAAGRWLR